MHSAFTVFASSSGEGTTVYRYNSLIFIACHILPVNKRILYLNIDLSQNNLSQNSRLFSSTGELICLQTRGFLEYNKAKNKESHENLQIAFFLHFPPSLCNTSYLVLEIMYYIILDDLLLIKITFVTQTGVS